MKLKLTCRFNWVHVEILNDCLGISDFQWGLIIDKLNFDLHEILYILYTTNIQYIQIMCLKKRKQKANLSIMMNYTNHIKYNTAPFKQECWKLKIWFQQLRLPFTSN